MNKKLMMNVNPAAGRGAYRTNLADALQIDVSRINIKGTTTEKLGFAGREEGIACEAVASIYR